MRIEINGDMASVFTPYNAEFVKAMRMISGARWDRMIKCWNIPSQAVNAVREIMMRVYGETDIVHVDKADIRVTFSDSVREECGPITMFGRTIAYAYGRDSGAKVGEKVAFIKKSPTSGGSRKNWTTVIPSGAVMELYDIPKSMITDGDGYSVEIIEKVNIQALIAEKEKLLQRLEEINAILGVGKNMDV